MRNKTKFKVGDTVKYLKTGSKSFVIGFYIRHNGEKPFYGTEDMLDDDDGQLILRADYQKFFKSCRTMLTEKTLKCFEQ
jgi:hypothetical protein